MYLAGRELWFSYAQILRLPIDPNLLSVRIDSILSRFPAPLFPGLRVSRSQARAAATFLIIRGLTEAPAPPALVAALYRVLAGTPGIQLLGRAKDATGRVGAEVAVRIGAVQLAMIVDPASGNVLESRRSVLFRSSQFPGFAPGVINQATFITHAVVRSDRP